MTPREHQRSILHALAVTYCHRYTVSASSWEGKEKASLNLVLASAIDTKTISEWKLHSIQKLSTCLLSKSTNFQIIHS